MPPFIFWSRAWQKLLTPSFMLAYAMDKKMVYVQLIVKHSAINLQKTSKMSKMGTCNFTCPNNVLHFDFYCYLHHLEALAHPMLFLQCQFMVTVYIYFHQCIDDNTYCLCKCKHKIYLYTLKRVIIYSMNYTTYQLKCAIAIYYIIPHLSCNQVTNILQITVFQDFLSLIKHTVDTICNSLQFVNVVVSHIHISRN